MNTALITYFVTEQHRYTIEPFLSEWAPELAPRFRVVEYAAVAMLPAEAVEGLAVFSDIDRLRPVELRAAIALADRLMVSGRRILNHPGQFVGRLELLRRLNAAGVNGFSAYSLSDLRAARLRYPVFLRTDSEHSGSLTPLLRGPWALALHSVKRRARGARFRRQIVVEYEDVSDPDTRLVRKYSYLRIGDRFIGRHVLFGKAWMLKYPDLYGPEQAAEENAFVDAPGTLPGIREVFDLAGIGYGRIDFSIRPRDKVLQVWEINTNPSLAPSRRDVLPERIATQQRVLSRIAGAFADEATRSCNPAATDTGC